jgi:hypothetical protein
VLTRRGRREASSGVPSRSEVRRVANELIAALGIRATSYANYQALQARETGDGVRMAAWRWIGGAVDEILRSEPEEPQPG